MQAREVILNLDLHHLAVMLLEYRIVGIPQKRTVSERKKIMPLHPNAANLNSVTHPIVKKI